MVVICHLGCCRFGQGVSFVGICPALVCRAPDNVDRWWRKQRGTIEPGEVVPQSSAQVLARGGAAWAVEVVDECLVICEEEGVRRVGGAETFGQPGS